MGKFKIISAAVLLLLALIVVLQNTEEVSTRLLFATVSMPRALLLGVTLASGILIGLLVGLRMAKKSHPKPSQDIKTS